MVGDMKFEESSLTGYLVKNLETLTEADPVILAEYVAALLKKDKPVEELQKLCTENLVEFLGQGTTSFITKLFQALEDGSIVAPAESLGAIRKGEPSPSFIVQDQTELRISSPKPEGLSPTGCISDPEEKEVSDDEDDDRNHKHRRREPRSGSFDRDAPEQFLSRPNRKRKPFENGQLYLESGPQPSETRKGYSLSQSERDLSAKFEKRRPGIVTHPHAQSDFGQRARINQASRADLGARFDLSALAGRPPLGRGRGRSSGLWNQHDSRFSSVESLDFASHMPPQVATPSNLFPGRGLPSVGNAQSGSWNAFGLIQRMPNGNLDTLHSLGLQGTLRPPIPPSLNIGMARQRCRDFEERGFCLRGDMCPMEHGVNRIVVEDVQSLSQFNLPVSVPSARLLGVPSGTGPLTSVSAPSGLLTNNKGLHGKSTKPGTNDDGIGLNGVPSSSAGVGEADLYDPDQPLWNTDHPETSSALLRAPSSKISDVESLWDADTSYFHSSRVFDGVEGERPGKSITSTASVWGRIGNSGVKIEASGANDNPLPSLGSIGNEAKEDPEEALPSFPGTAVHGKLSFMGDNDQKTVNSAATSKLRNDPGRNGGRPMQKALRTLFVNGIPQKSNKREALLSHFQKFGEVIDIYIPLNSERAFVQFSKRQEAEAALKAPDAVMGNRFIKLWWANRDSIPDDGINSSNAVSAAPRGVTAASIPSQTSMTDGAKENIPSAPLKVSTSSSDVPVPAAIHPKPVVVDSHKAIPPVQKKLENLELLKEELRKKQEMLDQKRDDFRRKLNKLEKQAISVKGETAADQAIKRHKVGTATDIARAASPRATNPTTTGERKVDKNNSEENSASPSPKTSSNLVSQSPRNLKQLSRTSVPIGPPFLVNRFKLDNRPTAFKILPPLPAELANVATLKEHFQSFGDLASVELDDSDSHTGLEPSANCSARVTFTTRRASERAFLNGKSWQGHSLQFSWLTTSSNSSNEQGGKENSPIPSAGVPPDAEVPSKTSTSGSSSTGQSTDICSQDVPVAGDDNLRNSEGIKGEAEGMEVVEGNPSSSTTVSSSETHSPKGDILMIEEGTNVSSPQLDQFDAQGSDCIIEGA